MEKCTNENCGESFRVSKSDGGYPGGKEREPVICAYCGTITRTEMTSAVFFTSRVDDKTRT